MVILFYINKYLSPTKSMIALSRYKILKSEETKIDLTLYFYQTEK